MTGAVGGEPVAFSQNAEFLDIDEYCERVPGWDRDYLQLDRGKLNASLQLIKSSTSLLHQIEFNRTIHQRGGTPSGFLTVGFLGSEIGEVPWGPQVARGNDFLVFPSGEYDSVSRPGFRANGFSISKEVLFEIGQTLDLPGVKQLLSGSSQIITGRPTDVRNLRRRLRSAFESAVADPSVLSTSGVQYELNTEIPTLLLKALVQGAETEHPIPPATRSRAARRGLTMIRDSPAESLTLQKICSELSVSLRTLEYAFREHVGITPKQCLQSVRLANVRRDLRSSNGKVKIADVANRWEFWHLGQFAADYRRHFGELPSATLSRT